MTGASCSYEAERALRLMIGLVLVVVWDRHLMARPEGEAANDKISLSGWQSSVTYALSSMEATMRFLSNFAYVALLIVAAFPALAQEASIKVETTGACATPGGASTGAVYMALDNKTSSVHCLTGASSDVADKLEIHEMKVVRRNDANARACRRPANPRRWHRRP